MSEPSDNYTAVIVSSDVAGGMKPLSCRDLFAHDFPELFWNIAAILAAGTMLLFGKPKKGKSFLALMIAICIAAGRPVFGKATSGKKALYMGLEDSEQRLKRRAIGCANALGITPDKFSDNLFVSTTARRIDTGLLEELHKWMAQHPDTGLIVVDMLKKVTGVQTGRNPYEEQALVGDSLTKFCHAYPELSIIVIHHSRKAESDDPFDLASGTTGLSGSYDSLAAIADTDGARTLHITGRDIEGAEIPLLMNDRGMYTLEEPDSEKLLTHTMSDTRRSVYAAVSASMPYTRQQIVNGCGLEPGTVDQQLKRLTRDGLINKAGRNQYQRTGRRFYDAVNVNADY